MKTWLLTGVFLLIACGSARPYREPSIPTAVYDLTFDFRPGDSRIDPTPIDLDRDGRNDHVLSVKYEKTRSEGYTYGNCDTKYTVFASLVDNRAGEPGSLHGRSWAWCSNSLPRRNSAMPGFLWLERYDDGKWSVCLYDDIVRCVP